MRNEEVLHRVKERNILQIERKEGRKKGRLTGLVTSRE